MINKVKVIKSHHSDVLIPFQAEKGEIVNGKEKPTQWDSFEEFQFIRAYNSFEISVSKGEFVKIKERESGWARIENESGKIGWIPLENLDIIEL